MTLYSPEFQQTAAQLISKLSLLNLILISMDPVSAEPAMQTSYQFYDIYPQNKYDLEKQMHDHTPVIEQGARYKGLTEWEVNWNFNWQTINGLCQITQATTALSIKYTLPKIPENHPVKTETRNVFNDFYQALKKHEEVHKDSGLLAAREIEKKLLSLGSFQDCRVLEQQANYAAELIIRKYNQRDTDYDQTTDHGRNEGVYVDRFVH